MGAAAWLGGSQVPGLTGREGGGLWGHHAPRTSIRERGNEIRTPFTPATEGATCLVGY